VSGWGLAGLTTSIREHLVRRRMLGDGHNIHLSANVHLAAGSMVRSRYGGVVRLGDRFRLDHGAALFSQGGDITIDRDVCVGPYSVLYGRVG
jgi:carbonic anhydrase/acetyltransferase-like protein (isoleucine patch superfamily)